MKTNRTSGRGARPAGTANKPGCAIVAHGVRGRRSGGRAGSVAAVVAGILGGAGIAGTPAHAQTPAAGAPAGGSAQTSQSLQEVVVTATATRVTKLDASYNVVTADNELIKESNPLNAADILKQLSPGIWTEASGGQAGNNIYVAGFPSGGDSPFFTNMIQGMPLYGSPNLAYMDSSSLFRLDDTIQRVEVVQGGPAAIFGPGQMGGTANYILKNGETAPGGEVSATYGTEGLWRLDAYDGFKVADGWYGSVGGFYRVSKGVRETQFPADNGGQLTATLRHDLDGGNVTFWARVLDDKNAYITPIPLIENSIGSYSAFPGFDPLTSTFSGRANQIVTLANPRGGFMTTDLANGRGGQLYYFGVNYDQSIGGWTLHNGFIIDGGGLDTNGWFSGPNPRPLSMYLYGCNLPEPTGWCKGTSAVDTNNLNGGKGFDPATYAIQARYAGSGAAVPLSQYVIQQSYHYIQKSLQNIADEFRVSRTLFKGNTLTGGAYLAFYSDNDNWAADNALMTATPNATPIVLSYVQNGHTYNLSSPQGFVNDNGTYNTPSRHGDAANIAGYLSDSWHIGPWLADVGTRLEHIDERQRTCNTTNQALGDPTYDLWDNKVPICNGTWDYEHYVRTKPTFTAGLNYEFSRNMSAYVRANTGNKFPMFDDIAYQSKNPPYVYNPIETIRNYEIGFKFQTSFAYLDISAYRRTFDGLRYQGTTLSGVAIPGEYGSYGAEAKGVDVNGYITPFKGFTVRVVGDYMDGHYDNNHACLKYTDLYGNTQCALINGAPLQRQPKFQVRVTPSYSTLVPWGDVSVWLTYEHVGQRYNDIAGLAPLGSYDMLSAGMLTDVGDNWQLRVQGTNLSNEIAITEGNARVFGGATGIGNVLLARPYEGREVNFSATYKF